MNFDGSRSNDPDADEPLTYEWDFTSDGTVDATGATATHTYPSPGKYTDHADGEVQFGQALRAGHDRGLPRRHAARAGDRVPGRRGLFRVGQEFTATGSATDAEGGQITLEWKVLQHHDGDHSHPLKSGTGDQMTFTAPSPEGLYSTDPTKNYLEIRLTATDSQGLSRTVVRELRPKTVEIGFETRPSGFRLKVNGQRFRAPKTLVSWQGYALNVFAPRQEDADGRLWGFESWSDGRPAEHTIKTPADPATHGNVREAATLTEHPLDPLTLPVGEPRHFFLLARARPLVCSRRLPSGAFRLAAGVSRASLQGVEPRGQLTRVGGPIRPEQIFQLVRVA